MSGLNDLSDCPTLPIQLKEKMKQIIILIAISLLFTGCATMDRVEGNVWGEANDESESVGGEVHYELIKF